SKDVQKTYTYFKDNNANILGELTKAPNGEYTFFVADPNGNIFNIVQGTGWFKDTKHPSHCGAVAGTLIGVSDIDKSLALYQDILGYETIEYDETGVFDDLSALPQGKTKYRRVLLTHKEERKGPFAKLLGPTKIELIQSLERTDCRRIFENRFWG